MICTVQKWLSVYGGYKTQFLVFFIHLQLKYVNEYICLCDAGSGYSPVLPQRQLGKSSGAGPGPTPSPDSAVYSCYSPTASPVTSRHTLPSSSSGVSSPFTPSLSRNNSDASQYGGSQHSSCYSQRYFSYRDEFMFSSLKFKTGKDLDKK